MSLLKKTNWFDIYLEEDRHLILVRLKWKYYWFTKTTAWTLHQKQQFHNLADNLIWKKWGSFYKVNVRGTSDFAKKHITQPLTINFDVQWVLQAEHWTVKVTKIKSGDFVQSGVYWNSRIIELDTEDTKLNYKGSVSGIKYYQFPVAHEFGHTIGNHPYAPCFHSDEYDDRFSLNGGFQWDYSSIMNKGNEIRSRHLDYILRVLNSMYTNTQFYL